MLFTAFLAGLFALIVQSSGKSSGGLHDNLIPFQIIADLASELHAGIWMGFWVSFPGNIVMFLPLGFFFFFFAPHCFGTELPFCSHC